MSENDGKLMKETNDSTFCTLPLQSYNAEQERDDYNSDATVEEETSFTNNCFHNTDKRIPFKRELLLSPETPTKRVRLNTQWPDNVQKAFEEAIALIPKKTLKNIKVNGITQGRNQYISMYIQYKTGIYRTPKQVSSHIQGLCSAKRVYPMKKLLIEGPGESEQIIENFSQLFSKIMQQQHATSCIEPNSYDNSNNSRSTLTFQAPSTTFFSQENCVDFKKIDMCYVNLNVLKDSHVFLKTNDLRYGKVKEINMECVHLLRKYPDLSHELGISPTTLTSTKPDFPLVTVDAPFLIPSLDRDLSSGNYNFRAKFTVTGMPKNTSYKIATVVMVGRTIIEAQVNQLNYSASKSKTEHTFSIDIASNYWKSFFLRKQQHRCISEISDIESNVNQTTIYHYIVDSSFPIDHKFYTNTLESSKVKCLLIWNFKASNHFENEQLEISKIKRIVNTRSPQNLSNMGTSHVTFKLSTPLSIIAEQRHNSAKSFPMLSPSFSTESPLSSRHLKFINRQDFGLQSLITPPHTAFPCTNLNEGNISGSHPVLFNDEQQEGANHHFVPHDIFNNIPQIKTSEDDATTEKEKFCTDDILDPTSEDYRNIFSSPNLQMYDFL